MLNTRLTGTMVRENFEGSGFVRADDSGAVFFVPATQVRGADLVTGDRLSFEARPGRQLHAVNIRKES
jgi:cold shock CspA family protein